MKRIYVIEKRVKGLPGIPRYPWRLSVPVFSAKEAKIRKRKSEQKNPDFEFRIRTGVLDSPGDEGYVEHSLRTIDIGL